MNSAFWYSFGLEIRKQFAYRADFWVNFILNAVGRLTVAYFLWQSVFTFSGKETIGGMTFQQTLIYFFVALFVDLMVRSSAQRVSLIMQEIYDGSLSRFLLYPVSVFEIKFARVLVFVILGLIQMFFGYGLLAIFFGTDFGIFSIEALLMGCLAVLPGIVLYFIMTFILEMVAFWADGVWSLNVILRFSSGFLGGGFLPLSMFPESWQTGIKALPFYSMIGIPTEAFLGQLTWMGLLNSYLHSLCWLIVLSLVCARVWRRGIKQFSGVGM